MLDWNLLITVLAGLGGVAVGGIVTWMIQDRQLKHIDENRFQEERMKTYTDFLSSSRELFAVNKLLAEKKDRNEVQKQFFMQTQVDAMREINDSYKKISIVGSKKTYLLAQELYTCVTREIDSADSFPDGKEYTILESNLEAAIREELKIDINT